MKQSKYWYGGANSVIRVMPHEMLLIQQPRGMMTAEEGREFAVALLEAASAAELSGMEITGASEAPESPPNAAAADSGTI